MKTDIIESIKKMIPRGKRLELPDEQISNYAQVKSVLLKAGGKYKRCGFEFLDDAEAIQARLTGGEAINDKKKFQFFESSDDIARHLIELADIRLGHKTCEPSAGRGVIADRLMALAGHCTTVEMMNANANALRRKGYAVNECDFLSLVPQELELFDRIVANPPFTNNQDIDHIRHMFSFLKDDGKLVSVASRSWITGAQKKQAEFRQWLQDHDARVTDLPEGAFKESGTNVATVIIELTKAA